MSELVKELDNFEIDESKKQCGKLMLNLPGTTIARTSFTFSNTVYLQGIEVRLLSMAKELNGLFTYLDVELNMENKGDTTLVVKIHLRTSYPNCFDDPRDVIKKFFVESNTSITVRLMNWKEWNISRNFVAAITVGGLRNSCDVSSPSRYDYNSPKSPFTDIIFIVGDGKEHFHCNKQFMPFISPVFEAMLLGDFLERNSDAIELKDVDPTDFRNMLDVVYPGHSAVTEDSVEGLLHIADRYEIQSVFEKCDHFLSSLCHWNLVDFPKLFYLADRFRLKRLLALCHHKATTDEIIGEIVNSEYFDLMSEKTIMSIVRYRFKK